MKQRILVSILLSTCLLIPSHGYGETEQCPYADQQLMIIHYHDIFVRHEEWAKEIEGFLNIKNVEEMLDIKADKISREYLDEDFIDTLNDYRYKPPSKSQLEKFKQLKVNDKRRINFCKADLSKMYFLDVDLTYASLWEANLTGVNFVDVNLTYASLKNSNLTDTAYVRVNLSYASLINANLTNASFAFVNLTNANFYKANLANANFEGNNLTNANFALANLTNANFARANLANVLYAPEPGTLPIISGIAHAKGLSTMIYAVDPTGLVQLRKAFYESGFSDQAREITYAIKHTEALQLLEGNLSNKIGGIFGVVFFGLTTDWGMNPGKALRILLTLILFFFFFYLVALQAQDEHKGIWRYRSDDRPVDLDKPDKSLVPFDGFLKTIPIALYFSILSAFHFGWRDLNVGNWIVRLQFTEYTFRPTGWVRTVAGIQSLISVYLVAIWALTHFGRPFN